MEEINFDIELRFDEIRDWQHRLRNDYGKYYDESQNIIVHYLTKYNPDRLKIYLGLRDTPSESEHHLDIASMLYGIQELIASYLRKVESGEDEQIELDWYIHRALEIDMPIDLIRHGYNEVKRIYPDYHERAFGVFETYLENYRPDLLPFYRQKEAPQSYTENMDAIDTMICYYWTCGWLKEEDEGKRKRRDTDFDIRDFMKLPPNSIPSMTEGQRKRSISHPFKIIDGGQE